MYLVCTVPVAATLPLAVARAGSGYTTDQRLRWCVCGGAAAAAAAAAADATADAATAPLLYGPLH